MSDGIKSSEYVLLKHRRQLGHVAEWLRRGLQIPCSNRLIPYKHCIIHHQIVQMLGLGLTIQDFIRVVKIPKDFLVSFIN